jgi:hypothetical protein
MQNTTQTTNAQVTTQTTATETYTSEQYATLMTTIFGTYEHPMLLQTADTAVQDEDDEVMDNWLASLGPREFEAILSDLAGDALDGQFALEPTA